MNSLTHRIALQHQDKRLNKEKDRSDPYKRVIALDKVKGSLNQSQLLAQIKSSTTYANQSKSTASSSRLNATIDQQKQHLESLKLDTMVEVSETLTSTNRN